jgi:mannose-6-phosphate isomerase
MGTHPTLPSHTILPGSSSSDKVTLTSYLGKNPALIGKQVREKFASSEGELPFLFKILSIGKALSIQAHPDKELAKRLHAEKPKMYKDDNHKPEMAIALTDFRGFCGFRPVQEIVGYLQSVKEFGDVIQLDENIQSSIKALDSNNDEETKTSVLRGIFDSLMKADPSAVEKTVDALADRYRQSLDKGEKVEVDAAIAELVCTLNEQFPGDVGVLCSFVLNVVSLTPGQAIFLKANEPHAYLDGEIVECMAASDNVVRAGLTPKARDVQVLVDMLTYDDTPSDAKRMKPTAFTPDPDSASAKKYANGSDTNVPSFEYNPPIDEFSVVRTCLEQGEAETHRAIDGPSLLIVTQGQGALTGHGSSAERQDRRLDIQKAGQVFFIGAGSKVTLENRSGDGQALITYRAFVEA